MANIVGSTCMSKFKSINSSSGLRSSMMQNGMINRKEKTMHDAQGYNIHAKCRRIFSSDNTLTGFS
jgi:hypothetical protein